MSFQWEKFSNLVSSFVLNFIRIWLNFKSSSVVLFFFFTNRTNYMTDKNGTRIFLSTKKPFLISFLTLTLSMRVLYQLASWKCIWAPSPKMMDVIIRKFWDTRLNFDILLKKLFGVWYNTVLTPSWLHSILASLTYPPYDCFRTCFLRR